MTVRNEVSANCVPCKMAAVWRFAEAGVSVVEALRQVKLQTRQWLRPLRTAVFYKGMGGELVRYRRQTKLSIPPFCALLVGQSTDCTETFGTQWGVTLGVSRLTG